jgi:hypothetical protein
MLQSYSQDKFVVGNNTNAFSTTPATTRPPYENAPGGNGNQRQPGSSQVNEQLIVMMVIMMIMSLLV